MGYHRHINQNPLSKPEKLALLKEYEEYYRTIASADRLALNRKLPREAFTDLLDRIGEVLVEEAGKLANSEGPVRKFLDDNPLPSSMENRLPKEFRAFCLALNAITQWVAAEQAATDRYLLGGDARNICRQGGTTCLITGEPLGPDAELHHPVRDGRPPIVISKWGHASIEGQVATKAEKKRKRRT
jgi:hypothetical protein